MQDRTVNSISSMLPGAEDNSMDFQNGVVAGWNACAEDVALGAQESDDLPVDTDKHSPDFYAGWLAGYREFMEKRYD